MLTTPNSYDIILDSNRESDFLLSKTRHRVGWGNFRFSIANRNVPFYLEDEMPTGIYKHKKTQGFQKGNKIALGNKWNIGRIPWHKGKKIPYKPRFSMRGIIPWNKGKICPQLQRENCGRWKGGKTTNKAGYIFIYLPNHPLAETTGYIFESRFVMEKHLKRYLRPKERVHHINHIKSDNRIENLKLFNNHSEHLKEHYKDREIAKDGRFIKIGGRNEY